MLHNLYFIAKNKVFFSELFVDEKKQCYQDLGYGTISFIGAIGSAVDKKTREMANKAKELGLGGNFQGDFNQMGGLLIVKKGNS